MSEDALKPELLIQMTAIEEKGEQPYTRILNLRKEAYTLILCFGTGTWAEMRVVGNSEAALNGFRNLLKSGGYHPSDLPAWETPSYQPGDESWMGWIFIDPVPRPLNDTGA